MKNKLLTLSIFVNIVCIGVIVFLDIRLNEYINKPETSNVECPKIDYEVIGQKYYHCESNQYKDDVTTYTYTLNYDFIYKENKLQSSSYYIKAKFNDKKAYEEFTVSTIGKDDKIRGIQDDETMTRYYDLGYVYQSNDLSLKDYISAVQKDYEMVCSETEGDKLIRFE